MTSAPPGEVPAKLAQQIAAELAELVGRTPLDGVMTAVMGPRSHLVEVQLPALHEILDSQNPRITAPAHERLALFDEPGSHGIVHARGRHDAQVEDAVAVDVLPYRETHDSLAVVHHDDARLVIERTNSSRMPVPQIGSAGQYPPEYVSPPVRARHILSVRVLKTHG